jgi:hypothetical protein
MDRRTAIAFATIFVGSGLVLGTSASAEQKSLKDQLVGSWIPSLASNSKSSFWPAAYSASWLTTLSAIFVKVASVFFSSCNVASRSPTASPRPSSLAQVFKVP